MINSSLPNWLSLIISLPSHRGTSRMRVWRALKGLGAAVLRDGVYLLPENGSAQASLQGLAGEVIHSGGQAHVLTIKNVDPQQFEGFRMLFDRTPEYVHLSQTIQRLKVGLSKRRAGAARRQLKKIRREFEAMAATDYFPGPAREQAQQLLSQAEVATNSLLSPGEPHPADGEIRRLNKKDFQNRRWATRTRPWVDRLASAWLIRRFIDPKARFVWLADPKDCPRDVLGFDFDGATFTHVGARVTFEVLLASFGLEEDAALTRLGALVHYLDVGGLPVGEAQGLEMILNGARQQCDNDDELLIEAGKTFNFLYASCTEG